MKMISMRTAICAGLAAFLLAFGSFALWENVRQAENDARENEARYTKERGEYEGTIGKTLVMSKSATTIGEWEVVRVKAQSLPEAAKNHFTILAQVRTIELLADKRDQLLANAGALFDANGNDPGVKENVKKALEFHERAGEIVQKIESAPENREWNKSLQYRKAYEKYRSLAFLAKEEHGKALDIIADAVGNLTKSLDAAPKDNRTELAIEFLYKRAKEEEAKGAGGGSGTDTGRPRAFPGPGPVGPGTGGSNRPRQH
ncbi:MAG: hypothetical protein AAB869_01735 [Patescibacteria group bacterium]